MIRMIFKSFFKRFFGLFISMSFVSMLAIGLLIAIGAPKAVPVGSMVVVVDITAFLIFLLVGFILTKVKKG